MKTVCVLFGGVSTEHLISGRSAYNIITGLQRAEINVVCVGITKLGKWIRYEGDINFILDGSWEQYLGQVKTNVISSKSSNSLTDMNTDGLSIGNANSLTDRNNTGGLSAGTVNVMSTGNSICLPVENVKTLSDENLKGLSVQDFLVSIIGLIPDVIFPAVHGINCEDGTLQGLLELSGIPYVGCGVLASAAGMDKLHAKRVFQSAKIPQCKYLSLQRKDIEKNMEQSLDKVERKISYPCFLKPNNGGSSVGTRSAKNREELEEALRDVAQYDRTVLIEEFIPCREIEAAVMGNQNPKVAMLGEVLTAQNIEYYDYKTKYFDPDGATVCIPAALSPKVEKTISKYAKKAYQALGCAGLSRVDFFIDQRNDKIYINEINTLPGFTPISLFPKAWAVSGVPIESLLKKLCELAIAEKKSKARLEIL